MIRSTLATLLLLFATASQAQMDLFQKTYGSANTEVGYSVVVVPDGYVMAGVTKSFGAGGCDMLVTKVSGTGAQIWSNAIGGSANDGAYCIANTSDGGFIVAGYTESFLPTGTAGSNVYIVKLDASGSMQWSKAIGGMNTDAAHSIIQTTDGGYAIAGTTQSFGSGGRDMYVARLDNAGNLLWASAIGGASDDQAYSIYETSTGSLLITGSTNSFSAPGTLLYFVKLSGQGNIMFSKMYNFSLYTSTLIRIGYGVIQNSNGNYVIAGTIGKGSIGDAAPLVMETDTSGNIIWDYSYVMNSGDCGARSIQEVNGEYILSGYMGNYYAAMIKIDNGGTRLWSKYYSTSSFSVAGYGYSAKATPDSGFVLAGLLKPSPSDSAMGLIKTDASGVSSCNSMNPFGSGSSSPGGTSTAVTSTASAGGAQGAVTSTVTPVPVMINVICSNTSIEDPAAGNTINIYPNPSQGMFAIGDLPSKAVLTVYDIHGNLVKRIEGNTGMIDLSGATDGVYILNISAGEHLEIKRLVKIAE